MRTYWKFSAAEQILFGQNTARQMGSELTLMGLRSAFIVTDSNLIKAGVIDVVRTSLSEAGIASAIFEGGAPEPSTDIVSNAVEAARKTNVDVVIGVGGGSNIDVAKVVAAILTHGGTPFDYFGEDKVPGRTIPIIDVTQKLKLAVSSNYLLPRLAVIDPLLTVSCPAKVTAESGMDALTHAVEAYTLIEHFALPIPADMRVAFPGKNPLSDAHATKAIQLIGANLRTAVYQPHNVAAREAMSLAALMAGMAFANSGLSAVHALQYPVGALTHTSHGLGNAILLPAVCDYLLPAQTREFAEIANLLGERADGISDRDAAMWAIEAIRQIKTDVGIPNGLSDIGVTASDIPAMAQSTLRYQRLIRCSPRPLNAEAFEWILRRAL